MQAYKNLDGDSNVQAYELGADFIRVQFKSGQQTVYTYTYSSAEHIHVDNMKGLAIAGRGLNSYIGKNKPAYSSKE